MRILALTNLYPNPRQPGRASFNRRQFAALAREHEVRVIAPIAWTSGIAPSETARVSDGMGVHHPRYVFTPKVLRGWYGHFLARSIRGCFEAVVAGFNPDVVLGSWAFPDGWAAVRLARGAGLPVAVKVHGSDLLMLTRGARHDRTVEALTEADAVITVGSHLRDRAVAMGAVPSRTHVVYNGIDASLFTPGPREGARRRLGRAPGERLILFVGNLVPVKGLDVLIEALSRVDAPFRCVCIGQGPLRDRLAAQARAQGLASRVEFIGARAQEELPDWYRAADLVVLPSRSEGIPNVLLEAAACGTPYVASDVGGIPEISEGEALVPPGDAGALAERIGLYLNPATRPVSSSTFTLRTWADSARALATVLHRIVRGSSAVRRAA